MTSTIVCSLSGSQVIEGVIDKQRGFIYEKSTILTHCRTHNTCPHTNGPLKQSHLIPIITGQSTTLLTNTKSVTQLIEHLANQYDSLILDAFMSKEELQKVRQELAVSLYQQDASLRVIAKIKDYISQKRSEVVQLMEQIRIKSIKSN